jgi:hypothetical protein
VSQTYSLSFQVGFLPRALPMGYRVSPFQGFLVGRFGFFSSDFNPPSLTLTSRRFREEGNRKPSPTLRVRKGFWWISSRRVSVALELWGAWGLPVVWVLVAALVLRVV